MSEWTIRYSQGEPVVTGHGFPFLVDLVKQARADRDAQWLAWIEEERKIAQAAVNRALADIGSIATLPTINGVLNRLCARVEGKK